MGIYHGTFYVLLMCVLHIRGDEQNHAEPANPSEPSNGAEHETGRLKDRYKLMKDADHIREHLKSQYGMNNEQTDEYLKKHDTQTQFFVLHDYDKNSKLDGLELLKSMSHHDHDHEDEEGDHHHEDDHHEENQLTAFTEFVDMVLKDQDYNNDGYIDYPEYIQYYSKLADM